MDKPAAENAAEQSDVIVAGAGPAGLSLAGALAGCGLKVTVVERQGEAALADPAFDGREIALTHPSIDELGRLGAWQFIDEGDVSALAHAHVMNGRSPALLQFDPPAGMPVTGAAGSALGALVPNHVIRRALYRAVAGLPGVRLLTGRSVASVEGSGDAATAHLDDGSVLVSRLVVAADTRFSKLREQQGIKTEITRYPSTILVCRLAHEADHGHVATEWFRYGETMALLPVNGRITSIVLTVKPDEAERLKGLEESAFEAEMARRLGGKLGAVKLASTRHTYPLVTTFARHFAAPRFLLAGDAAVGMHPMTAHGFNLGLSAARILGSVMTTALAKGEDIGAPPVLKRYENRLRLEAAPLYGATRLIAALYTNDSAPARVARHAVLRLGQVLSPVRGAVSATLMGRSPLDGLAPPVPGPLKRLLPR
ncbi:5-demethoxyubiquinol-8 5-hydroxylase UbiM [Radicibacter daui]|uniref:5-demethoxyubiquinol-8 5-hydroxylase UbiM n=1 Tax=Radicibacter daui TaxID=3064829 RepID=UPI004046B332